MRNLPFTSLQNSSRAKVGAAFDNPTHVALNQALQNFSTQQDASQTSAFETYIGQGCGSAVLP